MVLGDGVGASPTKDNQIQEGVSSQPVGTVDRGAGSFAGSPQTINHLVLATLVGDHLKNYNPCIFIKAVFLNIAPGQPRWELSFKFSPLDVGTDIQAECFVQKC